MLLHLITSDGTAPHRAVRVEDWGKRTLAYEINDCKEGYYTLIHFEAPSDFPAELDRVYNITEGVLRSMIVVKE